MGSGLGSRRWTIRGSWCFVISALAGFTVLSGMHTVHVLADPAHDALAKLNELSRQAEQTTEAMHSAELDLNEKLGAQRAADKKYAEDQAAVDAAKSQLATFHTAVNKFVAAMYMGGRTDGMGTILTAESPQQLIGTLAVQRVIAADMSTQTAKYRAARERAAKAEQASAKSAAEAKTAAEQAAAVRAKLQAKQSRLQSQIAVVKAQYQALTPDQRTALAAPGPEPPPATLVAAPAPQALAPGGGPPDVGAGGGPPDALLAPAPGSSQGTAAVQAALTRVGSPYAWGGAGPGAFDCSGLVMWSFQQAGISLPHSSQALAHGGQPVSLADLKPGDVLTFYSDASHAGIYVGDGMMVHSSTYGQPVRVVPMTASGPIHNARRY